MRVVIADANSIYANIDTEHALKILRKFLEELDAKGLLPLDFNTELGIEAEQTVMTWNILNTEIATSGSFMEQQWALQQQ